MVRETKGTEEQAAAAAAGVTYITTPSLGAQREVFFSGWRKLDTALLKVCNDDEMQTETTATDSQCEGQARQRDEKLTDPTGDASETAVVVVVVAAVVYYQSVGVG